MKSLAALATLPIIVATLLAPGKATQAAPAASEQLAIVTILEGGAAIYRGVAKLAASEAVRLHADDLFETDGAGFARIEFADRTRLDLGPKTRMQFGLPRQRKGERPALYLLAGWIKVTTPDAPVPGAAPAAFASPPLDCSEIDGVIVAHIAPDGGALFVESGRARFVDRRAHAAATGNLKSGEFLSWAKDDKSGVAGRPAGDFVAGVPAPFRNSISPRFDRYVDREVAPKPLGPFGFAEVDAWINAEPAVRRQFVHLWRAKADDAGFRAGLAGNLNHHPEWGPVLYPELYLPKPPPQAPQAGPGDATPAAPGMALGDRTAGERALPAGAAPPAEGREAPR